MVVAESAASKARTAPPRTGHKEKGKEPMGNNASKFPTIISLVIFVCYMINCDWLTCLDALNVKAKTVADAAAIHEIVKSANNVLSFLLKTD